MDADDGGTIPREEIVDWLRAMGCALLDETSMVSYWKTPNGRLFNIAHLDMKPASWDYFKDQIMGMITLGITDPDNP